MGDCSGRRPHPWRPAHIHFLITAPGYRPLHEHCSSPGTPTWTPTRSSGSRARSSGVRAPRAGPPHPTARIGGRSSARCTTLRSGAEDQVTRGRDRRADRRRGPAGGVGGAVPVHAGRRQHHDHEVPLDGEHPPRAHHQPARDGDLPRPGHRGPGARRRHPARADRRHRVLHDRRRGDRADPHLGHPPRPRGRLPARRPSDARRHPADLPRADPGRQRRRARHAGSASPPSTCRTPRTPTASRRRAGPADRRRVHDPGEVPDRRGRRPHRRWPRTSTCPWRARWTSPAR